MRVRNFFMPLLVVAVGFVFTSCGGGIGGGAAIEQAAKVPVGDYVGVVGFKPAEIINSGFFKKMESAADAEQSKQMMAGFEESAAEYGLKPDELRELVLFFPDKSDTFITFLDASTTPEKLMKAEGEKSGAEFEKAEKDGVSFWFDKQSDKSVMDLGGDIVLGSRKALENLIGSEEFLSSDETFKAAQGMVDANASFYGVYWGDMKMVAGMAGMFLSQAEGGAEASSEMMKLEAAGVSAYLRDDFELKIRLAFKKDADVNKLASFFNASKAELAESLAGTMTMLGPTDAPTPDNAEIKKLVEKISFSAGGNILEVAVRLTYDDIKELIPKSEAQ